MLYRPRLHADYTAVYELRGLSLYSWGILIRLKAKKLFLDPEVQWCVADLGWDFKVKGHSHVQLVI